MNARQRQPRLAGFDDDGVDAPRPDAPAAGAAALPRALAADTALQGQTVYVLDAHSLIYQVFHALPEMTSPHGQPVGALYGFLRDVVDVLERRRPNYLLCAFDPPGDTFRHGVYAAYKENRPAMPADLQLQIPHIQRFLAALSIPVLAVAGYEADDVLATVARLTRQRGGECYLVTSDKDCRQLITDQTRLYNLRKNEVVDAATVREEWGIDPQQVVDFQALWGDATDNVPGVAGIGPKTAGQLLAQFGTLEGIYAHLEDIPGTKLRERLAQGRDQALLSRQLVRLADDVPVGLDWEAARVGGLDVARVQELCAEFGFQRLCERLTGLQVSAAPARWSPTYQTVATDSALAALVATLARQSRIAIDTETTSPHPRAAELVGCSFSWADGQAAYVPLRAPPGEPQVDAAVALQTLRPILENPRIEKVGQNLKYDMIVLRGAGVTLQGVSFDTMVADYLLAPGERNHALDDLAKRYLNHETIKIHEVLGKGKDAKRMHEVPVALVTPYAAQDADIPRRLATILGTRLVEQELAELFFTLEMPLIDVLAEMEYHGIRVDVERLRALSQRFGQRMAELEEDIYAAAGGPFNIDSPRQLAQVLFDRLGLRPVKRTKTGPSTDADALSQLAAEHPLPEKIVAYRQQAKLKSTYADALPLLVQPHTGRVHTSFKQDVAATGRLSSTDPNLQNIPVRTPDGRAIRAAFVPGAADWQLLCADYSQIELRVLAHVSQDATLLEAFTHDRDIHTLVAAQVHQVEPEEVTSDMRRVAKTINFGIIYGQSPFGLAKTLSISKSEAAAFIAAYFAQYPGVGTFMDRTLAECRQKGYVSTVLGRRRSIRGIRPVTPGEAARQRNLPERIAINTVIQGSAADLIKQAMIRVHQRMRSERCASRLLLQIHDELVFEVAPGERDALTRLVVAEMMAVGNLRVPLKVDVKVGANWADCDA
ncbi:MAG: DNA polymerase I [Pirellulaceae bacterium]|nr:DNA polymerase I [Pirellulaceae bacterium]